MNNQVIKFGKQIKKVRVPGEIRLDEHIRPVFQAPPPPPEEIPVIEQPQPEFIEISEEELNQRLEMAYNEGFNSGIQEHESKFLKEYEHRFGLFDQLISQHKHEKQNFMQTGEEIIVKLALAIAQKILTYEVSINPEVIKNIARQALRKVSNIERKVTVQVNPADKNILQTDISDLSEEFINLKEILFQADERIKPGGCLIESNSSTIDATIETQLKEIEHALFKELKSHASTS